MSVPFDAADRVRHPRLETLAGELAKHKGMTTRDIADTLY